MQNLQKCVETTGSCQWLISSVNVLLFWQDQHTQEAGRSGQHENPSCCGPHQDNLQRLWCAEGGRRNRIQVSEGLMSAERGYNSCLFLGQITEHITGIYQPWHPSGHVMLLQITAVFKHWQTCLTTPMFVRHHCPAAAYYCVSWKRHLCVSLSLLCASQGSVCDRQQRHPEADHHQWLARGPLCGRDSASGSSLPAHGQIRRGWVKSLACSYTGLKKIK